MNQGYLSSLLFFKDFSNFLCRFYDSPAPNCRGIRYQCGCIKIKGVGWSKGKLSLIGGDEQ